MKKHCWWMTGGLLAFGLLATARLQAADEPWRQPDQAAMQRWQAMRFGMFIHWGPVSLTGHEIGWSRGDQTPVEKYDSLYKEFNPTKFNADEWVAVAKAAGMKYMVLTAKHHDGFCLWDTRQTDYNIMRSPFRRDVVQELAKACKRAGMAFGTYYSVCDWHHPDFPLTSPGGKVKREQCDLDAYNRYLLAQIKELIVNAGPLITIWNDVPQMFKGRGVETIKLARTLQPDILINDRTGDGGDYDTPEQRVGGFQMKRPWETCMTICRQWSWKPDDQMKTLTECLHVLIRTAGGDGNLLFNVGPMPTGEIEARQIERLQEMGAWLKKYGAAIYGTRGGPFKPTKHMVTTRRGNQVFVHILDWPEDTLKLPALPAQIVKSSVFTGGAATVRQTAAGVEIAVAKPDRQAIDTIVILELDKPAIGIEPLTVTDAGESLTTGKKATASNVFRNDPHYAASQAIDDDENTRWATDGSTGQCWLEVDLGQPQTFNRAVLQECVDYGLRVKAFELQYKDGERWTTFYTGKTIGKRLEVKFAPVSARIVRLTITEGQGGPTINEFQLFAPATRNIPQ